MVAPRLLTTLRAAVTSGLQAAQPARHRSFARFFIVMIARHGVYDIFVNFLIYKAL